MTKNVNADIEALEALSARLAEKAAAPAVVEEEEKVDVVSEDTEAEAKDESEAEDEDAESTEDDEAPADAADSEAAEEKEEGVEVIVKASSDDLLSQMTDDAEVVPEVKSEDEFLCGFQRKSVAQACDFCQGGCSPDEGMPGLKDIEALVLGQNEGAEVLSSGYSNEDDIFIVDVKTADGDAREFFLSGDGKELGWFVIDEAVAVKSSEPVEVVSSDAASQAAVKAIEGGGQVMGVEAGYYEDEDVYVVEIDGPDGKSYDVYVSTDGDALAYDEFQPTDESFTDAELAEIKTDEAELQLKRMYSRERREELAESGEAMKDGSFPIVDGADLEAAVMAHGRASDADGAKVHIIKRAEALELTDSLPEEWLPEGDEKGEEVDAEIGNEEDPEGDIEAPEEAPISEEAPVAEEAPEAEVDADVEAVVPDEEEAVVGKSFTDVLAEFNKLSDELNLS